MNNNTPYAQALQGASLIAESKIGKRYELLDVHIAAKFRVKELSGVMDEWLRYFVDRKPGPSLEWVLPRNTISLVGQLDSKELGPRLGPPCSHSSCDML